MGNILTATGTAHIVGKATASVGMSVCLSIPAWAQNSKPTAGLLLWAQQAGDINRLLQQLRAADEHGQCQTVSIRR